MAGKHLKPINARPNRNARKRSKKPSLSCDWSHFTYDGASKHQVIAEAPKQIQKAQKRRKVA